MTVKNFLERYFILILFFCFVVFYITIGQLLHYKFVTETYDVYFWADTPRIFKDLTLFIKGCHNNYHSAAHALIVGLVQPVVSLLQSFIRTDYLTLIVLQSVLGSSCVCLVFSLLKNLTGKKKIALICALSYGFSFSTILFCSIPETYIYSAFFQLLFWNYIIHLSKENKLSFINILTLSLIGVLCYGINLSNIIFFIIGLVFLLKEVCADNFKLQITNFLKVLTFFGIILIVLSCIQEITYGHVCNIIDKLIHYHQGKGGLVDFRYTDFSLSLEKLNDVLVSSFSAPVVLAKFWLLPNFNRSQMPLPVFAVNDSFSFHNIIIFTFCYLLPLGFLFKFFNNIKNKKFIVLFIFVICVNFLFNLFYGFTYGPSESILFSQNYLCLIFICLGLILSEIKNEKFLIPYRLLVQYILLMSLWQVFNINKILQNFTLQINYIIRSMVIAFVLAAGIVIFWLIIRYITTDKINNASITEKHQIYLWLYCIFIILYAFVTQINFIRMFI